MLLDSKPLTFLRLHGLAAGVLRPDLRGLSVSL